MLFNSLTFACFLPIVFGLYWALGKARHGRQWQNRLILAASLLFYGWWDWRFLSLLLISSITDYLVAIGLDAPGSDRRRKILLFTTLAVNLGMLGFFKYFNFFLHSLQLALETIGIHPHMPSLAIVLPVGISFYTFQTLSYTLDVYRREIPATRDPVAFLAFVSFFPQLVAGPIERAAKLLPQFEVERRFDYAQAVRGLRLILWGIIKKVVVADTLAPYVDHVYAPGHSPGGLDLLFATILFAIQIYCDFSGYSDVAIGTARLFGFDLMVNFRKPYGAASLREFWARWHISLSTWFRDYLYLPLGGNRGGRMRSTLNLLAVFVVSGLWHGAALSFVAWGLLHGLAIALERLLRLPERLPRWLWRAATLSLVLVAWVFFRANGLREALRLFASIGQPGSHGIFRGFTGPLNEFLSDAAEPAFLALLIGAFLAIEASTRTGDINELADRISRPARWALYYALAIALLLFGAYGVPQQFIYFQF